MTAPIWNETVQAETAPVCTAVVFSDDVNETPMNAGVCTRVVLSVRYFEADGSVEYVPGFEGVEISPVDTFVDACPNFRAVCRRIEDGREISPFSRARVGFVHNISFEIYWTDTDGIERLPVVWSKNIAVSP